MILCPNRSQANADNTKASVVTPATTNAHVALGDWKKRGRVIHRRSYPLTRSATTGILEWPLI